MAFLGAERFWQCQGKRQAAHKCKHQHVQGNDRTVRKWFGKNLFKNGSGFFSFVVILQQGFLCEVI